MSDSIETPSRPFGSSATWGTTGGVQSESTTAAPETEQIIITRNVSTGEVVNVETIDASGRRGELSAELAGKIAGSDEIAEIAAAIDEAFDSGVSMLLEEMTDQEEGGDDEERVAILRLLMIPLVGRRTVRRVASLRRTLLRNLILRRLARRYATRQQTAVN